MERKKKTNKLIWLIVILLAVGIIFQLVNYQLSKVKVVVYGTSTDSVTMAVENILADLQNKFGPRMKVDVKVVARQLEDGTILSLQTQNAEIADFDLAENIRQAVIKKYWPDKYLDYLVVRNTDIFNTSWQYFAEFAQIDTAKVSEKVNSEGWDLLKGQITQFEQARQALASNINSLPLVYINGKLYTGAVDHFSLAAAVAKPIVRGWRDNLPKNTKYSFFNDKISFRSWTKFQYNGISECYNDFDCNDESDKNGICQDVGTNTARCIYAVPAEVSLTVLNDKDCATCSPDYTVANLQRDFKGLDMKEIDVVSKEGDILRNEIGIQALPVYLFDASIEPATNFSAYVQLGYLGQLTGDGNYKYALVQAGIPGVLLNRDVKEKQLDIYVMSHCPYAMVLEDALIDLKEDINFDLAVHYVLLNSVDEQGQVSLQLSSLNGEAEYNENIRQLVIQKYYPDQFLAYLKKRNQDITAEDWQSVAQSVGIDVDNVAAKVASEGEELIKADAQQALDLGINSSPAYLWQNRYFGFGVANLTQFDKFEGLTIRDQDLGFCINQ